MSRTVHRPRRLPRTRTSALRRGVAGALVVALLAVGCGDDGGSDEPTVDDPAEAAARALDATSSARATGDDGDGDDDDEPVALDPSDIRGELINEYALRPGDCFDRLEDLQAGRPVVVTTRLSCDEPHQFEIYALLDYPATHPAAFPGEEIMLDFARRSCYLEFAPWVGADYEVSELEIGVLTPTRVNFEDGRARYRGIHCWVEHVDGEPLVGSMRGSGR